MIFLAFVATFLTFISELVRAVHTEIDDEMSEEAGVRDALSGLDDRDADGREGTLWRSGRAPHWARQALSRFHAVLTSHNYSESAARALLGPSRLSMQGAWPRLSAPLEDALPQLRSDHALAHGSRSLLCTFLLNVSVPVPDLEASLGSTRLLGELVDLGVLRQGRGGRWLSQVQLCPITTGGRRGALVLFVDWDKLRPWHQVMTATIDTYALLRAQRLTPTSWTPLRLLDLCSGSGSQGLHAAALFGQTRRVSLTLVDLNPRALRFAKANVLLNNLPRVTLYEGNLYDALPPSRCSADSSQGASCIRGFDLILANPPYVPSFGGGQMFVAGGSDGERITEAIVRGARAHLNVRGRLMLVANLANVHDAYLSKVAGWWLGDAGTARSTSICAVSAAEASIDVLHGEVWTAEQYAGNFLGSDESREQYRRFLRQSGVNSMTNAFIFARKTSPFLSGDAVPLEGCSSRVRGLASVWHALVDLENPAHTRALSVVSEVLSGTSQRCVAPVCPCRRCVCSPSGSSWLPLVER